ncbi:hypothetical protein [Staphylococcus succinus]|uniref:hypothetical protein n=1 Tax=Staphylococcus succinus TaxID=61015 RepID=UPI0013048D99|nr:hypothetical protein [Staphylococcus succinus]
MRIFIPLITLSTTVSATIGVVTEDIFNSITMYMAMTLVSLTITDTLKLQTKLKKRWR